MKKAGKIAIGIAVVSVVGLFAFFGIRASQQQAQTGGGAPRRGIDVDAAAIGRDSIVTKVSAKGTVSLIDQTAVYAQSTARVSTLAVQVGDTVSAGQVLVRYHTDVLENLEENMKDAQLSLRSAQINLRNAGLPASETELLQSEQAVRSSEKSIADLEAALEQTDINLSQLYRNLDTAHDTHGKNETLFAQGVITQSDLNTSQDAVTRLEDQIRTAESQRQTQVQAIASAQAGLTLAEKQYDAVANRTGDPKVQNQLDLQRIQVEQAQRQIDKIQKQIDEFVTEETSPIDGVVLAVHTAQGETAQEGRALLTIADTSSQNLVITVYIPEGEAQEITPGLNAEITGGALGSQVYNGVISKIYPLAEKRPIGSSTETAITIEITVTDADVPLKAGYTVDTTVTTHIAFDTLVVPLMAVLTEGSGANYVYIMTEDFIAERRDVTLGRYASLFVEAAGVYEGEMVIVNPPPDIAPGAAVRPMY